MYGIFLFILCVCGVWVCGWVHVCVFVLYNFLCMNVIEPGIFKGFFNILETHGRGKPRKNVNRCNVRSYSGRNHSETLMKLRFLFRTRRRCHSDHPPQGNGFWRVLHSLSELYTGKATGEVSRYVEEKCEKSFREISSVIQVLPLEDWTTPCPRGQP